MAEKEIVETPKKVEEGTELEAQVTEEDLSLLKKIWYRCGCESYYRYTCSLCSAVAQGPPERFERLVSMGLATHGGYSPYYITPAGVKLLEEAGRL